MQDGGAVGSIERIGNVYYRVEDMEAAVDYYESILGLKLKFRDGDNWAAFDVGGMTLALEGAGEPVGRGGGAIVSLRAQGLDELAAELRSRGADVPEPVAGPHERRIDLHDPSGNLLVLYEPLPRG
jgi:catechol 2,3-dioxygenase-like lactoylglutathione lyase family enzyme